jgi:hypothetical protein
MLMLGVSTAVLFADIDVLIRRDPTVAPPVNATATQTHETAPPGIAAS